MQLHVACLNVVSQSIHVSVYLAFSTVSVVNRTRTLRKLFHLDSAVCCFSLQHHCHTSHHFNRREALRRLVTVAVGVPYKCV